MFVCTGLTFLLNGVCGANVATIGSKYGKVKAGFFPIDFGAIGSVKFTALIVPSIVIAFLCAIESLLSATVAAGMTGTTFDANQELVGQGVANVCSSLLGGLPATGAIARTAASIENGAKSPLAGVFHSVFVLIMYFALMNVVGYIPLAVFAAILISVAINMSRFPLFIRLTRFGIRDVIVLVVTCVLTVVFDLTYGVLGGMVVTFIANAKNLPVHLVLSCETVDGISTVRASGTLYFLNAVKFTSTIEKQLENADHVVVDFSEIQRIDQTAMEKYAATVKKIKASGKTIETIGQNEAVKRRFDKFFTAF